MSLTGSRGIIELDFNGYQCTYTASLIYYDFYRMFMRSFKWLNDHSVPQSLRKGGMWEGQCHLVKEYQKRDPSLMQ